MAVRVNIALTAAWGPCLTSAREPSPPLPQTIDIAFVDDTLNEPDEFFTVTLSSPSGATLNVAASAVTITILENDVSGSSCSVVCASRVWVCICMPPVGNVSMETLSQLRENT